MFTLTSAAAQQIQQAARDSGAQDAVLRVAARRESDGGIDYGLGFDEIRDDDTQIEFEDLQIVIAPHHMELLQDTELDFVELEPGQFNFIFVNRQPAFTGGGCSTGGAGGCGSCGSAGGGCGSGGVQ